MPAFEQKNQKINCPYCGELIEVLVDPSEAAQEYVEDCFVCCRPIEIHVAVFDDDIHVSAFTEND